ncbi:MAG: hypothetical protein WCA78_15660 [Rhizomicrobium sp.]
MIIRPSIMEVVLDAEGTLRFRGISRSRTVEEAAAYVTQDIYSREFRTGAALIAHATLDPLDLLKTFSDALLAPATSHMTKYLRDVELELWRFPQPPARLTGGVGRTGPEPF